MHIVMSGQRQWNVCFVSRVERGNDFDCACRSVIVLNTANVLQTSLCDDIVACSINDTEERERSADRVEQQRI